MQKGARKVICACVLQNNCIKSWWTSINTFHFAKCVCISISFAFDLSKFLSICLHEWISEANLFNGVFWGFPKQGFLVACLYESACCSAVGFGLSLCQCASLTRSSRFWTWATSKMKTYLADWIYQVLFKAGKG